MKIGICIFVVFFVKWENYNIKKDIKFFLSTYLNLLKIVRKKGMGNLFGIKQQRVLKLAVNKETNPDKTADWAGW